MEQTPMSQSQLDYFRDLVRLELIPRVVTKQSNGDEGWYWECGMCERHTPVHDPRGGCPSAVMAKHLPGCKLKAAGTICE